MKIGFDLIIDEDNSMEEQEEAEPLSEAEQFKLWALAWNKKFEETEH